MTRGEEKETGRDKPRKRRAFFMLGGATDGKIARSTVAGWMEKRTEMDGLITSEWYGLCGSVLRHKHACQNMQPVWLVRSCIPMLACINQNLDVHFADRYLLGLCRCGERMMIQALVHPRGRTPSTVPTWSAETPFVHFRASLMTKPSCMPLFAWQDYESGDGR